MKKFFRKLLLFILIAIIVALSVIFFNGYKLFKDTTSKVSISEKVEEIRSDDNFVKLASLPDYYKNAVVAVEDHRYYNHGAIDFIAICRATFNNIQSKELSEGGSTITQQTAKNLFFIEDTDNFNRKIAEALASFELEKAYSKDDILEIYVNSIYFGDGYYGIKEACEGYLNKSPTDMTLYDSTMLAGIPNAPSVYAPTANFDLTTSRQRKVISSMFEYGYLTQDQVDSLELQLSNATFAK